MTVRRAPTRLRGRLLDAETGKSITRGWFARDDARRVKSTPRGVRGAGVGVDHHQAYRSAPDMNASASCSTRPGGPMPSGIEAARAGKVVGRVLDGTGRPIVGATVGSDFGLDLLGFGTMGDPSPTAGTAATVNFRPERRLLGPRPGHLDQEHEDVVALDATGPAEFDFTLQPDRTRARRQKRLPRR